MLSLCLLIMFLNDIQMYFARSIESDEKSLPNYDFDLPLKFDLEKQLKNKFVQKKKSEERLRKLNEQIANDTEYFEEIPHIAVKSFKNNKQANMENYYKKVIGMDGVKYTYKRGLHWRTWRNVTYPNKKTEVICYRCQNIINSSKSNSTSCNFGGYWVIEDVQQPCSYEILSFKNSNELCVAPFWQLGNANLSSCPSVTSFKEVSYCGIPIITNYQLTRDYSKNGSERALSAICHGRESCDFSTVYNVNPENIVFRIINSTNNIIYSKILKYDSKIYACVEDCGKFDFYTMSATRNEDHLVLNLLQPFNKKKRHNTRPKKHRPKRIRNTKKKNNIKSKEDALIHGESKAAFSDKDLFYLFTKTHKYILEQPLPLERSTTTTRSLAMCKQILLKELINDLKNKHFIFEK